MIRLCFLLRCTRNDSVEQMSCVQLLVGLVLWTSAVYFLNKHIVFWTSASIRLSIGSFESLVTSQAMLVDFFLATKISRSMSETAIIGGWGVGELVGWCYAKIFVGIASNDALTHVRPKYFVWFYNWYKDVEMLNYKFNVKVIWLYFTYHCPATSVHVSSSAFGLLLSIFKVPLVHVCT